MDTAPNISRRAWLALLTSTTTVVVASPAYGYIPPGSYLLRQSTHALRRRRATQMAVQISDGSDRARGQWTFTRRPHVARITVQGGAWPEGPTHPLIDPLLGQVLKTLLCAAKPAVLIDRYQIAVRHRHLAWFIDRPAIVIGADQPGTPAPEIWLDQASRLPVRLRLSDVEITLNGWGSPATAHRCPQFAQIRRGDRVITTRVLGPSQ